ncbi:hypothetical protein ACMD2_00592, partial [Ananas comosus]
MLQMMQQDAVRLAGKALIHYDVTESTEITRYVKKDTWARMVMHKGNKHWLLRDTVLRLFHILQHRQPCHLALSGCCSS